MQTYIYIYYIYDPYNLILSTVEGRQAKFCGTLSQIESLSPDKISPSICKHRALTMYRAVEKGKTNLPNLA